MTEAGVSTPGQAETVPAATRFSGWPLDKTFIGKAVPRDGGGWEVRIVVPDLAAEGQCRVVGMTDCATLEQAERKTWDFVRALTDDKDVHVTTAPDIGDVLMMRVIEAWAAMRDAKEAEAQAARRIRDVVKDLRRRGLSVTDISFLAHISRGRVSQLLL